MTNASSPDYVHAVRVYYEDTDASGVVYHTSYLRWMERGRSEWLRAQGGDHRMFMDGQGVAFTISGMEIRFRAPARIDDALEVHTRVSRLRRASIDFEQQVVGEAGLLVSASVRVACVDGDSFRPAALPPSIFPERKPRS